MSITQTNKWVILKISNKSNDKYFSTNLEVS